MRKLAAPIVAHLAGDLHLPQFPGAIQCVSYLLQDETTLAYSNQQGFTQGRLYRFQGPWTIGKQGPFRPNFFFATSTTVAYRNFQSPLEIEASALSSQPAPTRITSSNGRPANANHF